MDMEGCKVLKVVVHTVVHYKTNYQTCEIFLKNTEENMMEMNH